MNSFNTFLFEIFEIQNNVIKTYIKDYPNLYNFISKCHDCLTAKMSLIEWENIPENRRKVYNLYYGDIFSTLINATRLALQGCETDAFALLRVVNQELGEFNSIIELSLYDQAYIELAENAVKGKGFSGNFQKKVNQFKDKNRNYVYGQLSNLGSHPSPTRMRLSTQEDASGEVIMKVGMILNNPNTENSLIHISAHYLDAIRVFDKYFVKNLLPNIKSPLSVGRKKLEIEYQKLLNAGRGT